MYSREEAGKLRKLFWTSFGKSFPRKWTLYDTRIKDFSFKFYFDTKKAMVVIDLEQKDEKREEYWNKMLSLKGIFSDYLPDVVYEKEYMLENGKEVSRIYVEKTGVCIYNKDTWRDAMEFLNEGMGKMEDFWEEYKDMLQEQA